MSTDSEIRALHGGEKQMNIHLIEFALQLNLPLLFNAIEASFELPRT